MLYRTMNFELDIFHFLKTKTDTRVKRLILGNRIRAVKPEEALFHLETGIGLHTVYAFFVHADRVGKGSIS